VSRTPPNRRKGCAILYYNHPPLSQGAMLQEGFLQDFTKSLQLLYILLFSALEVLYPLYLQCFSIVPIWKFLCLSLAPYLPAFSSRTSWFMLEVSWRYFSHPSLTSKINHPTNILTDNHFLGLEIVQVYTILIRKSEA